MSFIVSGLCPFPVVGVPTQASSVVGLGKPTLRIPQAPTRRGSSPQCIRQALGTATGRTPANICTGTGLNPATSAPGLGSPPDARPLNHDGRRVAQVKLDMPGACATTFVGPGPAGLVE